MLIINTEKEQKVRLRSSMYTSLSDISIEEVGICRQTK